MAFTLTNSSEFAGKKGKTDWWNWTAFIEVNENDSLDDVEYVEYHLHPTFRNPVRRIHDKQNGFPLKTSGWGVFDITAKIIFKDKSRKTIMLTHFLNFD